MSQVPQELPPHVDDFLRYLDTHPGVRAGHKIVVRAAAAPALPTFSYSLPSGTLFAFPEFLAFLTLEKAKPGAGVVINYFVTEGKTIFTLHRWAAHPASILADVAKILGTRAFARQDKVASALANTNSFFIPFDRLRGVTTGRRSAREGRQAYLALDTMDGRYHICEDAATEGWFTSMGSMLGLSEWQPQWVALLKSAAARQGAGRLVR